jgi:hypothetical protein
MMNEVMCVSVCVSCEVARWMKQHVCVCVCVCVCIRGVFVRATVYTTTTQVGRLAGRVN